LSEAIVGSAQGHPTWPFLLALWGTAVVLFVTGGVLHTRGWARGFSQAQEGAKQNARGSARRRALAPLLGLLSPTRRELVLKELRVFARDSTQWSQLIMLAVLLVLYVANVRYLPLNGSGMTTLLRNVIPFLNLALAGFVLASIAARFVFPGVSLEGRAWWLLRSSPLPMREVLWAKFWVGAVPLFVLALILVGVTNRMLGVIPFVNVVSVSAIVLLVFPLTAMALAFGTFYPRFETENAAQIPTSFGGLLFMMSGVTLIAVVAFLTGRPAARYVVADHFGWRNDPMRLVLPFVAVVAVCVLATAIPLVLANRRLEAIERG
jgi:ABC-2 type transport system permease protein